MRLIRVLLLVVFASAIHGCNPDKYISFIDKVENIGIDQFQNIEYDVYGRHELYYYYIDNDSVITWKYNRKTKEFEYSTKEIEKIASDPIAFMNQLRETVHSLGNVEISQSPWPGNLVRFIVSRNVIIEYVNPDFKFDDRFKIQWRNEFISGKELKKDWFYIKI